MATFFPVSLYGKIISKVRISSTCVFTVGEIAVQSGFCAQWAMIDLGETKTVGLITSRVWTKESKYQCSFEYSTYNTTWTSISTVKSSLLYKYEIELKPVGIRKCLKPLSKYGTIPSSTTSKRTFKQMLGNCGILGTNGKDECQGKSNVSIFSTFTKHTRL